MFLRQAVRSQLLLRPQFSNAPVAYVNSFRALSTITPIVPRTVTDVATANPGIITHGGIPRPCLRVTSRPLGICPTKRPKGRAWNGPKISLRRQAIIRKKATKNGLIRGADADINKGEWCPDWQRQRVFYVPKAPRLAKNKRRSAERVAHVTKSLEAALKLIEEDKAKKKASKPTNFVEYLKHKDWWPSPTNEKKEEKKISGKEAHKLAKKKSTKPF